MPIVVVGTEKNFAALRPRLVAGRISTKAAGELAAAIRAANPHANLDKLTPGTVLTIPDAPNVKVRGELSLGDTLEGALEGLSNAGKTALAELTATAGEREGEAAKERKELAKTLASKELEAAGRKDQELAADLEATRKAVDEEDARAGERAAALEKAQGEWAGELDALKGLFDQ
jgi:hypothetical protein